MIGRRSTLPYRGVLVAALLAGACTSVSSEEKGSPGDGPAKAAAPAGPKVTLLDAGKEPRKPMRYVLSASYADKLAMTMTMAMEIQVGLVGQKVAMQLPPIRLTIEIGVIEKVGDDAVRCRFKVADVVLMPGGDAKLEDARAQMASDLSEMVGLAGTMIMDHRGVSRDMQLELPPSMSPQVRQTLESSRRALGDMSAPFPIEPVGIGARWQVDQPVGESGLQLTQETVFELVRLDGTKAVLKASLTQKGAPQKANPPDLPQGFQAELLSHTGAGAGDIEIDLRKLVPRKASIGVKTDTSMKVTGQGEEQVVNTKADAKVDMSPLHGR
jgi:hypothetical protein